MAPLEEEEMRRRTKLLIFSLCIISSTLISLNKVSAVEVQTVETQGSIGFTGVYEPIGVPDPTPPESIVKPPITEVAKPGGSLPQTNDLGQSWFIWLGTLLVSFVLLLWKRKKKQTITNKQ